MLELDSPKWAKLQTPYGSAAGVPKMLRAVEQRAAKLRTLDDWDTDPWPEFFNVLCHQGDIDSASIAALPHVVRIAAAQPRPHRALSEPPGRPAAPPPDRPLRRRSRSGSRGRAESLR